MVDNRIISESSILNVTSKGVSIKKKCSCHPYELSGGLLSCSFPVRALVATVISYNVNSIGETSEAAFLTFHLPAFS